MDSLESDVSCTCRVCLQQYDALTDMFPLHNSEYGQMLTKCVNISVSGSDGLPWMICETCTKEMIQAYNFLLKCKESDEKLRYKIKTGALNTNGGNNTHKDGKFLALEIKTEINDAPYLNESYPSPENTNKFSDDMKLSVEKLNSFHNKKESKHKLKRKLNKRQKVFKKNTSLSTLLQCIECDLKFAEMGKLRAHNKRFHSGEIFTCEICGKRFKRKNTLIIHRRTHTGEKPLSCSYCNQAFAQHSTLIRHVRIHTGDRPYSCQQCGKRFAGLSTLKKHMFIHSDEKTFTCNICGIMLKSNSSLKNHQITHTDNKNHICEQCGASFFTKGCLKSHMEHIHSEKSGYCKICDKTYSRLEDHMRKHTGETPFQCSLCNKSFSRKGSLGAHIKHVHRDVDKFPCQIGKCPKSFPVQSMLDFHILKYHKKETPHVCQNCSKGFYRMCDLKSHIRRKHLDSTTVMEREKKSVA